MNFQFFETAFVSSNKSSTEDLDEVSCVSRKSNKSAKFHVDHYHEYDEDQDVVDDDDNIQVDRIANHPAALLPSTARLRRFLDSDDDSDDGVYHREGSKNCDILSSQENVFCEIVVAWILLHILTVEFCLQCKKLNPIVGKINYQKTICQMLAIILSFIDHQIVCQLLGFGLK